MPENVVNIGDRFGNLVVIKLKNQHWRGNSWVCECDCGKEIVFATCHLFGSKNRRPNKSCGCAEYAHNGLIMENKKLYDVWFQMKRRCNDNRTNGYEHYGGKGIRVCDDWLNSYTLFYSWSMENGYTDGMTIDRINADKDYSPNNCRWVGWFTQAYNKTIRKTNKTGITGVVRSQHAYLASIRRNGVYKYLGSFKTLDEAENARLKAEEYFHRYKTVADL